MLMAAVLSVAIARSASALTVAVLYPEAAAPYRALFAEILEGIEGGLPPQTVHRYALPPELDTVALDRWIDRLAPDAVITLGRVAADYYEARPAKKPWIVGALDASPQTRPKARGVSLAVDPALLFATLRQLAPTKRRIWVVFDPASERWLVDLAHAAARTGGLSLTPLPASDAKTAWRQFAHVFETADPDTDALWLIANPQLVDPSAVLPALVEKSWRRSLVLFTNSLHHVHRGALFALYPDNRRLGGRLAELALQARDAAPAIEPLRAVKRAINLKIATHLALRIDQPLEREFDLVLPPW
ncbi:MAG: hypothetical protein IPK64_22095 [bacterium]|nr:hypothetical protein [bacterium]